jgi:choline dehydrogenase
VIVGAGAAGCVLANKLSKDKHTTVLLLEAGGDHSKVLESKIPIMFSKLFHTEHDWDYYTAEQDGLAQRRLYWPRGRMLGGSSSINAMMYHHCSRSDFDEWASLHGCQGWSYDDLAPYLRKMEKFTPNPARPPVDARHRGNSGQWQTGYAHLSEVVEKGFLPACNEAGIPSNPDINTPDGSLGATRFQTFIDPKGQRSSLATAYLTPEVLQRPNLYVACNALVTRVLFDQLTGKEPTAIGVELQARRGGDLHQVHARREVIVSGGAVNTPQTLLLSGIGPADELKKHSIPVVQQNEAVGRNLKDHLAATGILCKAKAGTTIDYLGSTLRALPALARWMTTGGGPLTSNAGEAAAFIRSFEHHFPGRSAPKDNTSGGVGPDVEIVGAPLGYIHHGEEAIADGEGAFTFGALGLRPRSSGTITLQSRNVFDARRSHAYIPVRYV